VWLEYIDENGYPAKACHASSAITIDSCNIKAKDPHDLTPIKGINNADYKPDRELPRW
jgi:hypothetical protein